jgi:CRISPR-associated endonuclease Csn1
LRDQGWILAEWPNVPSETYLASLGFFRSIPGMSTIWAFDLGKASIGEAVWDEGQKKFLHVASLLIPAEFASTKDAASRRRMKRTRDAHKAREAWLEEVWTKAGLTPLHGRKVGKVDDQGNPIPETEWSKRKGKWQLISPGDERLEREFAKRGDPTCYTSCLLRIKLLRGEPLQEWQIYKALRSAIQKRGYGRVPWAARELKQKDLSEEELARALYKQDQDLAKLDPNYREAIEAWPAFKEGHDAHFHYPCYYDAEKQLLWGKTAPNTLKAAVDHRAGSTRQVRFDRDDVEKEIAELARQAAKQLPPLASSFATWQKAGWTMIHPQTKKPKTFAMGARDVGEFMVHGPAGEPTGAAKTNFSDYLSFREKAGIHVGSHEDWMGTTGQKTPRFDNRIVNDCAIFDGMKACKVEVRLDAKTGAPYPDSLLYAEVTFLSKLKNLWVEHMDELDPRKLTAAEVQAIFAHVKKKALAVKCTENKAGQKEIGKWAQKVTKCFAMTEAAWERDKGIKELNLRPEPGHKVVDAPKTDGRSRYSRPALKVTRSLILSGQKPSEFLRRLESSEPALLDEIGMDVLARDPAPAPNGQRQKHQLARPFILLSHLKFLRDLAANNDSWEDLYIPEQRMDALEAKHRDKEGNIDRDKAIRDLIADNNDPIVRHRLTVFAERLVKLENEHGSPSDVILEFVRTDFMGDKALKKLNDFQKGREKDRAEAKKIMEEREIGDRSAPLKYELLLQQGGFCLYCGRGIGIDHIAKDEVDIDHIVPRGSKYRGPDAMVNFVLAHRTCNAAKKDQTPFEWLHGKEGWHAYVERVQKHATALRNKKVQLLIQEDAPKLVERYTALAETAWISKLAKKIVHLHFGWRNGLNAKGELCVSVVSGGLTGRIRRKYKLNSILNPNAESEEEAEKKNRKDHRHHALDAMVISQMPKWMGNKKKEKFFRFDEPIAQNPRGFFASEIGKVMPEALAYEQAKLAKTAYGGRWIDQTKNDMVIVQRTSLVDLAMNAVTQGEKEYDPEYRDKNIASVRDKVIRRDLLTFARTSPSQREWEAFCSTYCKPRKDGTRGPRVIRVTVLTGEPTEYREMSKDQRGTWRKGDGNHKGQIIYQDASGAPKVHPVYAHASIIRETEKLNEDGCVVLGFFQSGCIVETKKAVPAASYSMVIKNEKDQKRRIAAIADLPPSKLTLRQIVTKSMMVELTLADSTRVVGKIGVWAVAKLTRM